MLFKKSKGTHISEHKGHKEMSQNNSTLEFLNPEYVYIPLTEQNTPCECLVKVGDLVKIGQKVAEKPGRFSSFLHASVSGEVTSVTKKMWHASGKMIPTIEIKNDFQETKMDSIKPNNVDALSKDEIVEIVKQCGVVGLGGSGFPTYVKYSSNAPIDVVIINAAECEPYISDDYIMLKNSCEDVFRGIKYIVRANTLSGATPPKAVIAIKKTKVHLIEHLRSKLTPEDNIELFLLNDVYPAGWEKYIVERVTKKTYRGLPSEAGAIVNNVGTAIAIMKAVEQNMPLVEKWVTVTGTGLREPRNVYVKIGTVMSDIIKKIGGYAENLGDAYFIAGGPMTGQAIMFDSLIVHKCLTNIIVMPKTKEEKTLNCMGCGKCVDNCPVFLSPIQIKMALDAKDNEMILALDATRCMTCGLCSYVCPSRIELTDAVTRAKLTVMKK